MSFQALYKKAMAANGAADGKWGEYSELHRKLALLNKEAIELQKNAAETAFAVGVEIGLWSAHQAQLVTGESKFALMNLLQSGRLTFNEDIPL